MFVIVLAATAVAVKVVTTVHRFTPSNLVIRRVLTRTGYRWALPVGAAGVLAYGATALLAGTLAAQGGPSVWHLLLLVALYNAVRFAVLVPVATARLLAVRWRECRVARTGGAESTGELGPTTERTASPLSAA